MKSSVFEGLFGFVTRAETMLGKGRVLARLRTRSGFQSAELDMDSLSDKPNLENDQ